MPLRKGKREASEGITTGTTTETTTGTTTGTKATDAAESAAENILNPEPTKKRGRPVGSKNKPKEGTLSVSPADEKMAGKMFEFIFNLVAPYAQMADLTDEQASEAGEVFAPLIQKYLPILGNWQYEMAALYVVGGIIIDRRRAYVPPTTSEAEVIDDAPVADRT